MSKRMPADVLARFKGKKAGTKETRSTKKGATVTDRKRKDGTIQRKRVNADGSVRTSRRSAEGTLKSATRKTTAGGTVKSMKRDGKQYSKKSERVAKRNSAAGIAAKKARVAKRKAIRVAARKRR